MTQPQPFSATDSTSPVLTALAGRDTDTRLVLSDRLEPCETNEYDDDSCSDSSALSDDDDDRNHREIALPSGTIQATVQNSTGTTIAHNLTNINGPVTIHNYPPNYPNGEVNAGFDGTLGITHRDTPVVADVTSGNDVKKNAEIDSEACHSSNTFYTTASIRSKLFTHFGHTSRLTAAFLALILAATIAVAIYYTLFQENHFPIPSEPPQNIDLGEGIILVLRAGWNARPPKSTVPFTQKPPLVIVKHTGGGKCFDRNSCTSKMVALQSMYVVGEKKMRDIDYHFVIGNDGNVYEGRGWDVQDESRLNSISICYTGNFVEGYDKLTSKMVKAGVRLLKKGLELGKLRDDYKVVAHNQTYNTQSPGGNIYKEVKKWPHYYGGLMFN